MLMKRCLFVLLMLSAAALPLAAQENQPLKIGLLPVLDTLPFYIAEENGYFEEAGVAVEAVPVASPVERDQVMQAGEIDGMLTEMTTTATFNREEVQVQILMSARVAYENYPIFRILTAPESGLGAPTDLAGVPIGVSRNTVIEYLTDRLLQAEGVEDIVVESVPVIPERFQLLMQGQLQAATLPDPLAQAALDAGAALIIEDSAYPEYSVSVLSFSVEAIESKPEAIRRFLWAWDQAVADLNADPEAYRALFLEKANVPESVQETYAIPPFPRASVPDEAQWADVLNWLVEKDLLENEVPYTGSVNPDFLPETQAAPEAVRTLYQDTCQACHGAEGVGGTVGPDLADSEKLAEMPAGEIHDIVANGVEGTTMQAYGDSLAARQIRDLVALIKSWND